MGGMTKGDWINSVKEEGLENAARRFYGDYPTVVSEDSDPQQQARVKVNLSMMGFPGEHPRFAYPITPYGGRNFGFYFPAHKDEAVWVTFDHGDMTADPMYSGSWWLNPGDNPDTSGGDKNPEKSYIPAEFRMEAEEGSEDPPPSPTRRGIKSKGGSVWMFEDDPENYYVEFSTGKNETETENVTNEQGVVVGTREAVKAGEVAEKHHRFKMDDTAEQIVVATWGIENPNAEEASDQDSEAEKARKELESRFRHQILMRDKEDDRFGEWRTPGDKDKEELYHRVLMSDTDELIRVLSNQNHAWEINDKDETMSWEMREDTEENSAFVVRGEANKKDKFIVWETMEEYRLRIDEKEKTNTLETPNGQQIIQDDSNTLINDDDHDINLTTSGGAFNITAANASEHKFDADLTVDVGGSWMQKVMAMLDIAVTGSVTIKSDSDLTIEAPTITVKGTGSVTIESPSVDVGTGNLQPLVNELIESTLNNHTHSFVGMGAVLGPQGPILIKGVHTTIATNGA